MTPSEELPPGPGVSLFFSVGFSEDICVELRLSLFPLDGIESNFLDPSLPLIAQSATCPAKVVGRDGGQDALPCFVKISKKLHFLD